MQPLGEEVGLLCSDNYSRANFNLLDTGTLSKKKGLHLFLFVFVFDILIVQDGAILCKMVQDGARWCKMVQDGAR